MGYLGRRIGLSQDNGDSNPGAAGGAVGGGLLDLFAHGYFERQGDIYNNPGVPPITGLTATGGIISDYTSGSDVYRAHVFTSSGTFDVSELSTDLPNTAEYLLVAGGGGGGDGAAPGHGGNGGGGAGGYVEGASLPLAVNNYTITIGAGGQAFGGGSVTPGTSRNGTPSTISSPVTTTLTAKGGGGGGEDNNDTVGGGAPVGSGGGSWGGGGSSGSTGGAAGQSGTNSAYGASDYGNAGGDITSVSPPYCAGGGGGAGGAGQTSPNSVGGHGGIGKASTIAYGPTNPIVYAGGGGGGATPYGGSEGAAPPNGGGGGASGGGDQRGTAGTGGGGGAHGAPAVAGSKLSGGSGIVVVRYQIGTIAAKKATGGAISFYGGKTIHAFIGSGDFTVTNGPISADYLVIGGGGGGGNFDAGGGGAGLLRYATGVTIADGPYGVTIGAGGASGELFPGAHSPGGQTVFSLPSAVTSPGGGGGGPYQTDGGQGGSGGGGGGNPGRTIATGSGATGHPGGIDVVSPTDGWGNDGAVGTPNTSSQPTFGGGGGGAAALGDDGVAGPPYGDPNARGGNGGDGARYSISGTTRYYAGGGGGGSQSGPGGEVPAQPQGGQGGGGAGGYGSSVPADQSLGDFGEVNTGSGGGGGGQGNPPNQFPTSAGGLGGSGIVIIAYPS